jgi:succinoglycan biosynthesis transport protein ExoP
MQERRLTVHSLIATTRTWLGLLLLSAVLGAAVSLLVALNTPPTYIGKATLVVSPRTNVADLTLADVETARAVAATLAEVATAGPLLERSIVATDSRIDLPTLSDSLRTNVPTGTSLIEISVKDRDPEAATTLANGIADELVTFSAGLEETSALRFALSLVDAADNPIEAPRLDTVPQVALGAVIGLLVSICLATIVENLGRAPDRHGRPVSGADLSGVVGSR